MEDFYRFLQSLPQDQRAAIVRNLMTQLTPTAGRRVSNLAADLADPASVWNFPYDTNNLGRSGRYLHAERPTWLRDLPPHDATRSTGVGDGLLGTPR